MKPHTNYWRACLVCFVAVFTYMFLGMNSNYNELLKVNEELREQLNEERCMNLKTLEGLREDYKDLSKEYSKSLAKIEELNKLIEEYENTATIPEYKYSRQEVFELAKCVQAEAGHYKVADKSQRMITKVILNRVESEKFPNTLHKVIYQKRGKTPQFSVAYNGALDKQEVSPETLANVYSVLLLGYDMPENVLYFYADNVKENWVNKLKVYDTVQGTMFAYE